MTWLAARGICLKWYVARPVISSTSGTCPITASCNPGASPWLFCGCCSPCYLTRCCRTLCCLTRCGLALRCLTLPPHTLLRQNAVGHALLPHILLPHTLLPRTDHPVLQDSIDFACCAGCAGRAGWRRCGSHWHAAAVHHAAAVYHAVYIERRIASSNSAACGSVVFARLKYSL